MIKKDTVPAQATTAQSKNIINITRSDKNTIVDRVLTSKLKKEADALIAIFEELALKNEHSEASFKGIDVYDQFISSPDPDLNTFRRRYMLDIMEIADPIVAAKYGHVKKKQTIDERVARQINIDATYLSQLIVKSVRNSEHYDLNGEELLSVLYNTKDEHHNLFRLEHKTAILTAALAMINQRLFPYLIRPSQETA